MRTKRFFRNLVTGVLGKFLTVLLHFITRTVFIYTLGKEYLGINSLFSNVLSVLSITELGIGVAIVFNMYKPIADKDEKKICSYMNLMKKCYRYIGAVILLLGVILSFFLDKIINIDSEIVNLKLYFFLYVFQSVTSYWFFSFKRSILQADQKRYVINLITYGINILMCAVQVAGLIIFKSFLIYSIFGILQNIIINIIISRTVNKNYPYLKENKKIDLTSNELVGFIKNVAGMSVYKINSVILRSTDSIVISTFISTVAVGIYDNYHMIVASVLQLSRIVFSSLSAGVGNLFVTEDEGKQEKIFRCISLVSFWLYGQCGAFLWILLNPFMTFWLGEEFLLSQVVVGIIVFDFITDGFQIPVITYKDSCGLFWEGKFRPLATAIVNLIVSVILAPKLGIAGVILGTVTSRLVTTFWFDPMLIYKNVFKLPVKKYFIRYFSAITYCLIMCLGIEFICEKMMLTGILDLIMRLIITFFIYSGVLLVVFRKTEEFKYLYNTLFPKLWIRAKK